MMFEESTIILAVIGMIIHAIADTSFAALIKPLLDGSFIEQDKAVISLMPILIILIFPKAGFTTLIQNTHSLQQAIFPESS